ncbi:hypothetical protein [Acinetobacter radioresistens]|uniref:Uncharacterized protein n=1 Tax=Acinetobacter radioresistens TaxID=40216 RepID=A0A8H2K1Z1_ACIRA|nr:hypothetical protein [Acinetobacter radioresistens]TNX93130.1 hypothetical protein FHY67_06105 [Acinetobacter radioresistens]
MNIYTPGFTFTVYQDGMSKELTVQDWLAPENDNPDLVTRMFKDSFGIFYLFARGKFYEMTGDKVQSNNVWYRI